MQRTLVYAAWAVIVISVSVMVAVPSGPPDCDDDWRKCEDLQAFLNSASNGIIHAQSDCERAGEKRAQYGEPRWGYGFSHAVPSGSDLERGRVQLMAKDAEFQNGFGAWQKTTVVCTYDLERETVTNVRIAGQ